MSVESLGKTSTSPVVDSCHNTGGESTAIRPPWADDPRAEAKDALCTYTLEHAYGVPVIQAARAVLDRDVEAGDADHRLVLRFFGEDYAHLFKTTRRDGLVWVKPRPVANVLNSSRQTSPQFSTSTPDPQRATGSLSSQAPGGRAASTARAVLRDRCQITPDARGADVRAALTHALAAHRSGVDCGGMRDDRVSSPERVARRQATFLSAFDVSGRRYREGVLLTLTARPGESGDMVDTNVLVNADVDPLQKWLRRRGVGDAVLVRELTGRGVLHLHVVAFGVSRSDVDRDELGRYWHDRRGHGFVVDVAPVERRFVRDGDAAGGRRPRWVFTNHGDASTERGRFVRSYLGEGLFRFREVAESSPADIHADAVADGEFWKVVALWTVGLPIISVSANLRRRLCPRRSHGVSTFYVRFRERRRAQCVSPRGNSLVERPAVGLGIPPPRKPKFSVDSLR